MPYNTQRGKITWEMCTLRKWLNGSFFNFAFNTKEQSAIQMTTVSNMDSKNNPILANTCSSTKDRIFLLSYHEAFHQYFSDERTRKCLPTDYAIAQINNAKQGINIDLSNAARNWWLRTPGAWDNEYIVNYEGKDGYRNVDAGNVCVRPAFWLDLDQLLDIL